MSSPDPLSGLAESDGDRSAETCSGSPDPAARRNASHPGRSAVVIAWAGYLIYGIPVFLSVPALVTTAVRFGTWPTLTDALPAALTLLTPLLAWLVYTARRRHGAALGWLLVTVAACMLLLITPLFFWAGPALTVVAMEAARLIASRRGQGALTSFRRRS